MLIGVVGAPNKGKSTFFSALTATDVPIADYPFTTIDPNKGVAYVRVPCAHTELGLQKCDARGGHCKNGVREIPIQLLDVAGLVPDAHEGRGLGNRFLDDLRQADALIQVVDASGRTDLEGKPSNGADAALEVKFLENEIDWWLEGILKNNYDKIRNRSVAEVAEILSGFGAAPEIVENAVAELGLPKEKINWNDGDFLALARKIRAKTKPISIAANKADVPGALDKGRKLASDNPSKIVVPCSSAAELALRKANDGGAISYRSGADDFEISGNLNDKQKAALEMLRKFIKENGGTGVPLALHKVVFDVLKMKVVYPVEDERKFSNHMGDVLPDALLVPDGTTTIGLAAKIHTDLAKRFIGAVDCKTQRRVGKDHPLKNGDVIKIIAGK